MSFTGVFLGGMVGDKGFIQGGVGFGFGVWGLGSGFQKSGIQRSVLGVSCVSIGVDVGRPRSAQEDDPRALEGLSKESWNPKPEAPSPKPSTLNPQP